MAADLVATGFYDGVRLTWSATQNAANYRVYRDGVLIATSWRLVYTDEAATVGRTHGYVVHAVVGGTEVADDLSVPGAMTSTFTDPTSLAELRCWFRPESHVGADGSPVASWHESITGLSAPAVPTAQQPVLKHGFSANKLLPAVLFDGGDDYLPMPSSVRGIFNNGLGGVIALVGNFTGSPTLNVSTRAALWTSGSSAGAIRMSNDRLQTFEWGLGTRCPDTGALIGDGNNAGRFPGPATDVHIARTNWELDWFETHVNGTVERTNVTGFAHPQSNVDSLEATIGRYSSISTSPAWTGHIGEVLAYSRPMNTRGITALNDWLTRRWTSTELPASAAAAFAAGIRL